LAIILIVAEKADSELYRSLSLTKENIEGCSFNEAKDFINQGHFNLTVLDCGLEVGRGMEVLRELKTTYSSMPIIFVTSISSNDIALKAFRTGARDFFKKPLNVFELQETIKGILAVKRSSKEIRSHFKGIISSPVKFPAKATPFRFANLSETIRYIERNLSNRITLDKIAEEAHISKSHFYKLFKRRTGKSLSKFVTAMRIEKAKELFQRDNLSISMAAIDVGFSDYIIFTKHFKKITGMTPAAYKRSFKVSDVRV